MIPVSKPLSAIAVTVAFLSGCGGDTAETMTNDSPFGSNTSQTLSATEAEARATAIISGVVVSSRRRVRNGIDIYEVYVQTESGAVVSVYISVQDGSILEVEQESGGEVPNFQPADGFIALETAIEQALAERAGDVIRWELELDDDTGRWKYEVYIRAADGAVFEVEIDAITGATIEIDVEADFEPDDDDLPPVQNGTTAASLDDVREAALRQALVC